MKPVLLIRPEGNERDQQALADFGISSIVDPYLTITANSDHIPAQQLLDELVKQGENRHFVATSSHGLRKMEEIVGSNDFYFALRRNVDLRLWAIGTTTQALLEAMSGRQVRVPPFAHAESLATELLRLNPGTLLLPSGNLSLNILSEILTPLGWSVISKVVYLNSQVSIEPTSAISVSRGEFSGVLLRSPSAVAAFLHFVPDPKVALFCAGPTTAKAVEAAGFTPAAVAINPEPEAVARVIFETVSVGE